MQIDVQIDGLKDLKTASIKVQQAVTAEMLKGLAASAKRVETDAKRSIANGGKTGRVYKRRGVAHRASAAGEAPATDTGRLVNSIQSYVNKVQKNVLEGFVVAGRGLAKYAAWLEFGTRNISPRPFLFPAAEKNKAWIMQRLRQSLADGIKKGSKK
jgi:HK97 gp10 family phage protein